MIHLFGNMYLDANDLNYILVEWDGKTSTNKKGNTTNTYKNIWYFNSLEYLAEKLLTLSIRRKLSETTGELNQLTTIVSDAYADMQSMFKPISDSTTRITDALGNARQAL